MRLICGIGLLALALVWSGAASAADLELSLGTGVEYDTNVRRSATAPEDDVLFQIFPGVRIFQERSHDLNFDINYTPQIEFAVKNGDELNDVDQFLDAEILYSATGRLDFFVRDDFRYLRSTLRSRQTLDSTAIPAISTGRDRVTVNQFAAGAIYRLTPRLSSELEVSHRYFDTTRADRADARRIALTADLTYQLDTRSRFGFGFSFGRDEFDETPLVVGSKTDGIVAFARWRYQVTDRIVLDMRAGPAYYQVNQKDPTSVAAPLVPTVDDPADPDRVLAFGLPTCDPTPRGPVFVGCDTRPPSFTRAEIDALGTQTLTTSGGFGKKQSDDIDAVVSVDLSRRWSEQLSTNIRYSREPGVASGVGGTVIRDSVTLAGDWAFAPSWAFFLRGDWVLRKSLTNSFGVFRVVEDAVDNGANFAGFAQFQGEQFSGPTDRTQVDTQNWSGLARISYQFRRHTTAFVQGTYDRQESVGGTLASGDDFDVWIASFGIVYTFDPFRLGR